MSNDALYGVAAGVAVGWLWGRKKPLQMPFGAPIMDYSRFATVTVASPQARDPGKYDLRADGTNDWEQIMNAWDSLPAIGARGEKVGTIAFSEGKLDCPRNLDLDGYVNLIGTGADYLLPTVINVTAPIPADALAFLHLRGDIGGRTVSRLSIEVGGQFLVPGQSVIFVDDESRRTVLDQIWIRGSGGHDGIRFRSQHSSVQHVEVLDCDRAVWCEYRLNHVFNVRATRCKYGLYLDLSPEYSAIRGDRDRADYNYILGFESVAVEGGVAGIYVNGVGNFIRWWDENGPAGYTPVLMGPDAGPNDIKMLREAGMRG